MSSKTFSARRDNDLLVLKIIKGGLIHGKDTILHTGMVGGFCAGI